MPLFDLALLAQRRAAAQKIFDARLFSHAAQQLRDRLTPLRVIFDHVLDLTPSHTGGLFPFFQDLFNSSQWQSHLSTSLTTLPAASADLILSALDVQWIEELPSWLRQVQTLLKPGGLFLCTFWGGETLHELRHALFHAESFVSGGASPRVIPMLILEEGARLLQSTGFTLPVADHEKLIVLYPDLRSLCKHLRVMGETNALFERKPASSVLFREAEHFYRGTYGTPEGELPATFQLMTLTGWAPAPDQPQPLKRGSASHRLTDLI